MSQQCTFSTLCRVGPALSVVLTGAAAGAFTQPEKAEKESSEATWYPLHEGSTWTYVWTTDTKTETHIVIRVASLETKDGRTVAKLEHLVGSRVRQTEQVAQHSDGVYRHAVSGRSLEPPLRFIALPPEQGQTWSAETRLHGSAIKCKYSSGFERVQVPAGKFEALRVSMQGTIDGEPVKTTGWYARGVGMVKQTLELNKRQIVLELKSTKGVGNQ